MRVRMIGKIESFNHKLKRVCAYMRVSTSSISQGLSLENQEEYFERIIKENPEYEFVGIFSDSGVTGTKVDRPQFQRMLTLAESGGIDIIPTKSISRFARNTVELLNIVRQLKEINVKLDFKKRILIHCQGMESLCFLSSLLLPKKKANPLAII